MTPTVEPLAGLAGAFSVNGHGPSVAEDPTPGDIGLAQRFVADHVLDLRFVPGVGWHAYDGRRWKRDTTGEAKRRAIATVKGLYAAAGYAETNEDRKALGKLAQQADHHRRLEAMLALAAVDLRLVIESDALDRDGFAFNAHNGTGDLRSGELRPHRREDFNSKVAAVATTPLRHAPHGRHSSRRSWPATPT